MPLRSISNTTTPLCMDYTYLFTKPTLIYCYTPLILTRTLLLWPQAYNCSRRKTKKKLFVFPSFSTFKFQGKTSRCRRAEFVRLSSAQRLGNYPDKNIVINLAKKNIHYIKIVKITEFFWSLFSRFKLNTEICQRFSQSEYFCKSTIAVKNT